MRCGECRFTNFKVGPDSLGTANSLRNFSPPSSARRLLRIPLSEIHINLSGNWGLNHSP